MKVERCLVCGQQAELPVSNTKLLESQLTAIFVLRELLELPTKSLEKCFRLSEGKDPATWISLCGGECQRIVENARDAHQEMCTARQKLLSCQKKIRDKIQLSNGSACYSKGDYRTELLQMIWEGIDTRTDSTPLRSFDFAAGDRMANKLLKISKQPNALSPRTSVRVSKLEPNDETEIDIGETFAVKAEGVIAVPKPKKDTTLACDQCPKTFVSHLRLRKHKWHCHRPKTIKHCPHCDYTSNEKSTLNRHIRLKHDKTQIFACAICHQKFTLSTNMHRHQAFHHNICSVKKCGKVCANREDVRDHQIKVHGKEVDVFQCPECDMLFRTKSFLSDHVKTKHRKGKEIVYSCGQCDMVYLTRKQLTNHVYHAHKRNKSRQKISEEENLILGI